MDLHVLLLFLPLAMGSVAVESPASPSETLTYSRAGPLGSDPALPPGPAQFLHCPPGINNFSASVTDRSLYYHCQGGRADLTRCPRGLYIPETEACDILQSKGSDRVKRSGGSPRGEFKTEASLGRKISLGGLYDDRTSTFLPGFSLWTPETVKRVTLNEGRAYQTTNYQFENNVFDRMALFNIDANLKLSFLGGLIEVGGSAHYLRDSKELETSVRFNMEYQATYNTETVPRGTPNDFPNMCDDTTATHVVSQVTRGMNAVFIFEKSVSKSEVKSEIEGSMKVVVKSIPSFDISGEATITANGNLKNISETMSVKFHGDIILETNPSTLEEAAAIYKTIGEKARASPQIVEFTVTPISYYCDVSDQLLNKISANNMDMASEALADFEPMKQKIKMLMSAEVSKNFLNIRAPLTTFETKLISFENDFKEKLLNILPNIKSGRMAEAELITLIDEYVAGPFYKEKVNEFLGRRRREIKTMSLVNRNDDDAYDVTDEKEGTDNRCIFSSRWATTYIMNVLPKNDIAETYFKGEADTPKWFDENHKVGKAGQKLRLFREFSKENKDQDHCFMVQLKQVKPDPVSIEVYKDGASLFSDFDIPPAPEKPTLTRKGSETITIGIDQKTNPHVTGLVVEFTDNLAGSKKQIEADYSDIITVPGLQPLTSYSLTVRYKTEPGLSPASAALEVLTLANAPKKPTLKSKDSETITIGIDKITNPYVTGLVVEFTDTLTGSKGEIEADFSEFTDNLANSKGEIEADYVDSITVPGLKSLTSYSLTVRYKTEPGLSPASAALEVLTLANASKKPTLTSKGSETITIGIDQITNTHVTGLVVEFTDTLTGSKGQIEADYSDSITVPGLQPLTSYSLTVRYKTESGLSPASAALEVLTLANYRVVVMQRRGQFGNTPDYFDKSFDEYEAGFGQNGEVWLGLRELHRLTTQETKRLRVELLDWDNKTYHAVYDSFKVGASPTYTVELSGFRPDLSTLGDSLTVGGRKSAGPGVSSINGESFSTKDRDQDSLSPAPPHHDGHCSKGSGGSGWWFADCGQSNMNGRNPSSQQEGPEYIYWLWSGIRADGAVRQGRRRRPVNRLDDVRSLKGTTLVLTPAP